MTDVLGSDTDSSPLEELERLALEVANDRNISPGQAEGDEQLRGIVRELVDQWRADFRRGIRRIDLTEPEVIVDRAMSNLTGYGPLTALLEDDDVWEIMLNAPEETLLDERDGEASTAISDEDIAGYWRILIAANQDRLIEPGNPDLILPGQELTLPPVQ